MTASHIGALLADACARGLSRIDAQRLMSQVIERPRAWLLAHDDEPFDEELRARYEHLVARRLGGEPLAYLLNDETFHGLGFEVTPAVLIPRADTEVLVDWAIECIDGMAGADIADGTLPRGATSDTARAREVVDLGTGSGVIAITVALRCGAVAMTGVDISADALGVARGNASRHGVAIEWQQGSWWTPLATRRFHLALANPPYIAVGDAHLPALRHEPTLALVSGADGLDALREIVGRAPCHLRREAWLLVEHGFDQGAAVRSLFEAAGFAQVQTRRDTQGHERCTGGRWPA